MKEYKYFVDTNIFLRPVVKDNIVQVNHCEHLIKAIAEGEIKAFTSLLVLAEFVWVSQKIYTIQKEVVIKALKGILGIKNLEIDDSMDPSKAVEMYANSSVKFIDTLIASHTLINHQKAKVISYDRDFDKLKVERVEPGELK